MLPARLLENRAQPDRASSTTHTPSTQTAAPASAGIRIDAYQMDALEDARSAISLTWLIPCLEQRRSTPPMRLSTVSRVCSSPCPFLSCASGAGPRFALAVHLGLVPCVLPRVSGVIARPLATAVLGPALALEARDEMEDEGLPLQVNRLVPRDMTEGSWGLAGRQPRRGDHRLRFPRGSANDPHRPKRRPAAHLGDGVRRPSEPHKRKTIGPAMSPLRAPLAANRNFVAEAHGSANPTPRAMFTLLVRPSRGRCEPPPQETVTEVTPSVVCRVEICRPLWWCLDRAWPSDH